MYSLKRKADEKITIQRNACNNTHMYKTQKHSKMTVFSQRLQFANYEVNIFFYLPRILNLGSK